MTRASSEGGESPSHSARQLGYAHPAGLTVSASHSIVRQVRGGENTADHRFVLLSETESGSTGRSFTFAPTGAEMTMRELCDALMAQGISEADALALVSEAIESFHRP